MTIEGENSIDTNGKDIDVEQLDDDHSCKVRMQSGKLPITNATILRDHIQEIKHVFYKFANQHNKLLESQQQQEFISKKNLSAIESGQTEDNQREKDLENEIEALKKQLADRDALIVKMTKLRSRKPSESNPATANK